MKATKKNDKKMNILKKMINNSKIFSLETIEKVNSGHPGSVLSMSDIFYIFFQELIYDKNDPKWINRDILILSNGHLSIILYLAFFIFNIKFKKKKIIEFIDIKNFRQKKSNCSGHPEFFKTIGIETTTGLLGQGLAIGIGMCLAVKWKKRFFNEKRKKIFNQKIIIFCGDGCLMEGVSYEALSLAFNLNLNNIIINYDKNNITIDGNIKFFFRESIITRIKNLNFLIIIINHKEKIKNKLKKIERIKKNKKEKILFVICNTIIAKSSPNYNNKNSSHGKPLGYKEIFLIKTSLKWKFKKKLFINKCILSYNKKIISENNKIVKNIWNINIKKYKKNKKNWKILKKTENKDKIKNVKKLIKKIKEDVKETKIFSNKILNKIQKKIYNIVGGSADLENSTKFKIDKNIKNNIKFGVREISMSAITAGMSLMNLFTFNSTFLAFSDYLKPILRTSSMMKLTNLSIFTHDSFSIGEDGATHQPIEQLNCLRLIPNIMVFRPFNNFEIKKTWELITKIKNNTIIFVLPRNDLKKLKKIKKKNIEKGCYLINKKKNQSIVLMCGEELNNLLVDMKKNIFKKINLYSMFCLEIFNKQQNKYKLKIIKKKKIIIIEKSNLNKIYIFTKNIIKEINGFGESERKKDIEIKNNFNNKNIIKFIKYNIKKK